jgi:hypothetical protein
LAQRPQLLALDAGPGIFQRGRFRDATKVTIAHTSCKFAAEADSFCTKR